MGQLKIRRGEQSDSRIFTGLVNSSGGAALFRATFGHFNFSTLIEYSYLTLIALSRNDEGEEICVGFFCINDSISSSSTESDAFDRAVETLSDYIPVKVNCQKLINFY